MLLYLCGAADKRMARVTVEIVPEHEIWPESEE